MFITLLIHTYIDYKPVLLRYIFTRQKLYLQICFIDRFNSVIFCKLPTYYHFHCITTTCKRFSSLCPLYLSFYLHFVFIFSSQHLFWLWLYPLLRLRPVFDCSGFLLQPSRRRPWLDLNLLSSTSAGVQDSYIYTHTHVHVHAQARWEMRYARDMRAASAVVLLTLYTNLYLIPSDIIMQPIVGGEGDR